MFSRLAATARQEQADGKQSHHYNA
jgi:hypothetical protein